MPPSDQSRCFRAARFLLVLLCTLGPVTVGSAQTPQVHAAADPELTGRGRFILSGALGGSWSRDGGAYLGNRSRWRLSGTPSLTYFVRDHIGAGLHLGGGIARGAAVNAHRLPIERSAEQVFVGVHGAFDVPIAKRLSLLLWPAVGYVHEWSRETQDLTGGFFGYGGSVPAAGATFQQQAQPTVERRYQLGYVRCVLSTLLLFHLSSSVGVGFGPELWLDFIVRRQPNYRSGSVGGPDDDVEDPVLFPQRPARQRFQVGLATALVIAF